MTIHRGFRCGYASVVSLTLGWVGDILHVWAYKISSSNMHSLTRMGRMRRGFLQICCAGVPSVELDFVFPSVVLDFQNVVDWTITKTDTQINKQTKIRIVTGHPS